MFLSEANLNKLFLSTPFYIRIDENKEMKSSAEDLKEYS